MQHICAMHFVRRGQLLDTSMRSAKALTSQRKIAVSKEPSPLAHIQTEEYKGTTHD